MWVIVCIYSFYNSIMNNIMNDVKIIDYLAYDKTHLQYMTKTT